jgi:hypothetical protein
MKITPVNETGDYRTGTLQNTSVMEIQTILGFEANVEDDPDKVEHSWGFEVDGVRCGIWDYKGSQNWGSFSTFGPEEIFKKLFGNNYVGSKNS